MGRELSTLDDYTDAARGLISRGQTELVALSLGAGGAVLVSADEVFHLPVPNVTVVGTVGAGDSFLAGFVLRLAEGCSLHEALITAVAAGTAATLTPGTTLCNPADVARFEAELRSLG